jgi:hypothetical protein
MIYILIGWSIGMVIYYNSESDSVLMNPTVTMIWSMLLWPVYIIAFLSGLLIGTIRKLTNKYDNDG